MTSETMVLMPLRRRAPPINDPIEDPATQLISIPCSFNQRSTPISHSPLAPPEPRAIPILLTPSSPFPVSSTVLYAKQLRLPHHQVEKTSREDEQRRDEHGLS